ncbi:VPS13B isoform 11, partial [Pan troglodytes]
NQAAKEDTVVLKIGSVAMAPQADNPLGRSVLRKDIYHIRRHQERRAILTPVLTDFSVRITGAPAVIFTKVVSPENLHTEEILVCGHSLEVNITTNLDFFLSVAQVQLLHQLIVANMTGLEPSNKAAEISKQEQKKVDIFDGGMAETSSRYSGAQ